MQRVRLQLWRAVNVRRTEELKRILALPRRSESDFKKLAADMTEVLKTPKGTMALRPVQALALHDIGVYGGLFGCVGVGEGKTLISLLAPYVLDAKKPLLILPAGLVEKTERERRTLSEHWLIPTNVRVHSCELLGRAQAADELERWAPDVIVVDEVHKLKNLRAACTRRVARYMAAHSSTRFVGMSGTVMGRSILDFSHILWWALKMGAPLPQHRNELEEWASALDEVRPGQFGEVTNLEPGALLDLCSKEELREQPLKAARLGFRRRLVETPGVVATAGDGERVDCSIYVRAKTYKVGPVTDAHFATLRQNWERPDGWPLVEGVDVWRHARELALGFHYVRVDKEKYAAWRTGIRRRGSAIENATSCREGTGSASRPGRQCTDAAEGRARFAARLSVGSASTMITEQGKSGGYSALSATERSAILETLSPRYQEQFAIFAKTASPPIEWLQPRRDWAAFVRRVLSLSRTYDSELQVANACDSGGLDPTFLEAWRKVRDSFKPATVAVWHDESVLKLCADWMHKPGIVWTEHSLFGNALSAVTGCSYYGAKGLDAQGQYIEDGDPKRAIIASIDANREGKNLQAKWSRNLVVSPPEGAEVWQQTIARTHRPGQAADEVIVDVLLGCREHVKAWRNAVSGTHAVKDTVGGTPKLLLADVAFPSDEEIDSWRGSRW